MHPAGSAPLGTPVAAANAGAFSFPRPDPAGLWPTAQHELNVRAMPWNIQQGPKASHACSALQGIKMLAA